MACHLFYLLTESLLCAGQGGRHGGHQAEEAEALTHDPCSNQQRRLTDRPHAPCAGGFWLPGVPSSLTAHQPPRLALTQVCAVVLELLGEFLQVGLSQRNDLPASGLLQHSSIPVVGTHSTQQNPVLALERGHTSTCVP